MIKSDGSVMVHADHGGYKPSNWMTPPAVIEEEGDPLERIVVRKRAGASEDRLEIRVEEILSDVEHDMGEAAGLEKDGVRAELQVAPADAPAGGGGGCRAGGRGWTERRTDGQGFVHAAANGRAKVASMLVERENPTIAAEPLADRSLSTPANADTVDVRLSSVRRAFGDVVAVDGVDLAIR